jgi:hypothetical protein
VLARNNLLMAVARESLTGHYHVDLDIQGGHLSAKNIIARLAN